MAITFVKPEVPAGAKAVSVTFTNGEGKVFSRSINVPYTDGEVNEAMFDQFLADHLRAVEYKASIGIVEFRDPAEEPVANTAPPAGE